MDNVLELFTELNIVNILLDNKIAIIFLIIFLMVMLACIIFLFIPKKRKEKFEDIEEETENKVVKESNMSSIKEEKKDDKFDLEAMLAKMEADLKGEQDEITSFEEEQEEKAIISYKELKDAANKKKEPVIKSNIGNLVEDNNKIISNYNEEFTFNEDDDVEVITDNKESKDTTNKFKHTDFISPVYGVVSNDVEYPTISGKKEEDLSQYDYEGHDLEKTLNIKPLSDEIKKNADFLRALKEFRNNL